jgi:hypothetical protein
MKVTDASLDPFSGEYCNRLRLAPQHWPIEPVFSKRPKCAFHRWAANLEEKVRVVMCSECKVHLCIQCFKIFHEEANLVARKNEICNLLLDQKKAGNPMKRTGKDNRNTPKKSPRKHNK